jgi:hypothetical protein
MRVRSPSPRNSSTNRDPERNTFPPKKPIRESHNVHDVGDLFKAEVFIENFDVDSAILRSHARIACEWQASIASDLAKRVEPATQRRDPKARRMHPVRACSVHPSTLRFLNYHYLHYFHLPHLLLRRLRRRRLHRECCDLQNRLQTTGSKQSIFSQNQQILSKSAFTCRSLHRELCRDLLGHRTSLGWFSASDPDRKITQSKSGRKKSSTIK